MPFLLTDFPQKLKLEKIYGTLIILFYVSLSSPQLEKVFLLKTKNNQSLASHWWEYTKSHFKENAKIFSKNSTTQKNITISRQIFFQLKTQKKTSTLQQGTGGKTPNRFLKIQPLNKF